MNELVETVRSVLAGSEKHPEALFLMGLLQ
jgi:hypothetical protein